jgi:hypothetical protein
VSEPYGTDEIPVPADEEAGSQPADEKHDELNWLD